MVPERTEGKAKKLRRVSCVTGLGSSSVFSGKKIESLPISRFGFSITGSVDSPGSRFHCRSDHDSEGQSMTLMARNISKFEVA